MKFKQIQLYIIILMLTAGLAACSDNSSGPDHEQPPSIPELTAVAQPDVSFFDNNSAQNQSNVQTSINGVSNYSAAKFKAAFGAFFLQLGQIYLAFLNPASNNKAAFNDGMWEWTYNYADQGKSASVRLTAQEQGQSSFKWAMYISFDDGQGGGYDNYKIIEGTTSNDGATGNWTFYSFDTDNKGDKAIVSKWNVVSKTDRSVASDLYDGGSVSNNINYKQEGTVHSMIVTETGSSGKDEIYWNTETRVGYVIDADEGTKKCWDAALQDVPCDDVGL